jgi:Protein ENHANCED DISEASE RESISTANCE 2, C-terminal
MNVSSSSSTVMITDSQQSSSSTTTTGGGAEVVIRHAGSAHVRGRIRRVWRPRYLELTSDGRLLYYEYSSQQQQHESHQLLHHDVASFPVGTTRVDSTAICGRTQDDNGLEPPPVVTVLKYTLTVTAARILDVTTIRDLHTGLMRGSFGFLIRGQKCESLAAAAPPPPLLASVPDGGAQEEPHAVSFIKEGNEPLMLNDTQCSLAASFLLAADESLENVGQPTPPPPLNASLQNSPQPIRDYLCAVPTLEEAQMWVVALQWAASLHNMSSADSSRDHQHPPPRELLSSAEQWWKVDYCPPPSSTTDATAIGPTAPPTPPQATAKMSSGESSTQSPTAEPPLTTTPTATTTTMTSTTAAAPKTVEAVSTRKGKILVTAVTNYAIVRSATWSLEIAYEISVLLLYQQDHQHGSGTTSTNTTGALATDTATTTPTTPTSRTTMAEHWSVRRTASQLEQVAGQLNSRTSSPAPAVVPGSVTQNESDDGRVIGQLPTWAQRPTAAQVDASLSIVDSLLRSWVLSAEIANTAALKLFLGLSDDQVSPVAWWQVHGPGSDDGKDKAPLAISEAKVRQPIPSDQTREAYVKEWLLRVRRRGRAGSIKGPCQWLLQWRHDPAMHWLAVGGVVVATSLAPAAYRFWQRVLPVVPLRLDILVASWAGASYVGYWYCNHQKSSDSSSSGSKRSTADDKAKSTRDTGVGKIMLHRQTVHPSKSPVSSSLKTKSPVHVRSKDVTSTVERSGLSSVPVVTDGSSSSNGVVVPKTDDSIEDDFADFVSTESRELFDIVVGHDEEDGDDDDDESDGDVLESGAGHMDGGHGVSGLEDDLSQSTDMLRTDSLLSSPLPCYPDNNGMSCWSQPPHDIFHVRGASYFTNKIKVCSGPAPLQCRGVDIWLTDNPERHIARHPAVLGGKMGETDTFLVNFLLPFGNFVSYFSIPPLREFPDKLRTVWTKFLKGDQEYRDARLKLLPVVVDGPWIVKTAVGPGKSPALLGKAIPLQYYFRDPDGQRKGVYEVDVIITASAIAKGILSIVKSQTKSVSIAFAFIIEAAEQSELPETVLCCFQVHSLHLEDCPTLPKFDQDEED